MGQNIGDIFLNLGVNSSGFKKQMNGITKTAQQSTNKMTGMFGKLGGVVAAAFSVAAVANFAKACINLGSDLAEVQNVVDVTFGEMSGAVNKWAKDAMTTYGLSEKTAKDYMGQFGAMSKAFGNTTDEAYKQATALAGLTGDVASFYNLTTDEAFTKLKAVYTGETEALKSLGVVMTQTALDEFALQKGLGKTTDQMSEQEKVALRLSFVQERLASASGDFVRTSDGWANQVRVLSLRFDALKASIGQGLINVLLPVVRLLNQLISYLQIAADAFSDFTAALFGKSESSSPVSVAASASGELASNMGTTAKTAKQIKKTLAGFDQLNILSSNSDTDSGSGAGRSSGAGLGSSADTGGMSAGAAAAEKMKTLLGDIKTKLVEIANVTGLTGMWNDFLTGVESAKLGVQNLFTALSGAITTNMPELETFKASLYETFLQISQTVTGVWGSMWTTLTENFQLWTSENQPLIEEFFSNAVNIIAETGTLISDIVGDIFEDIKSWWDTSGQPVFDGFLKALGDVWEWLLTLYNTVIAPVVKKIISIAKDLWEKSLRPLFQNLLGLISDVGEMMLAWWNNHLKPVVTWIVDKFGPPIRKIFERVAEVIGSTIRNIVGVINGLVTILRGVIQFITGVFSGDWEKAWEGIKKVFSGIWNNIKNTVGIYLNPILSAVESFINSIIKGLNKLIQAMNKISVKIPDWVPEYGGKSFGISIPEAKSVSIPRLATGGYVAANTPQLAVIGDNKREGEIVAPESKIAEAVARGFAMVMSKIQGTGGSQSDKPMYLTIKLGEGTFWEGFVDYHNSVVKCTGESPLLI